MTCERRAPSGRARSRIGLVGGILQVTTVSQVLVFGVPADLTPLLVASVGLLCGSVAGATFGFCLGLFVDTVLFQTLGVSSLVLLVAGYGAGRVRELRDPGHSLIPVAVGAAAAAVTVIGFSVLQFLLGVDAPVSLLLVRQILLVIVLDTLLALPGLRRLPARPASLPARRSPPASPPRIHDRRPQPAQPRVDELMPPDLEERRPAITPQLAVRVAVLGGLAFVLFAVVFFRLWFLQVLTGEDYVSQARENRVRKIKIEAPRGNIVDRNGQMLVKTRVAPVVQIAPKSLPAAELEVAEAYRPAGRRPSAGGSPPRASSPRWTSACMPTGGARRKPEKRERRRLRRAANRAAARAGRPHPAGEPGLRRLYRRLGQGDPDAPARRSTARSSRASPRRPTPT